MKSVFGLIVSVTLSNIFWGITCMVTILSSQFISSLKSWNWIGKVCYQSMIAIVGLIRISNK